MRYFTIIFLLISCISQAQSSQTLSPQAKISLLTCDPGNELYATFGHSALWIRDPINRIDKIYNYGTFSFDTPNFYMKFMRGHLNYQLSVSTYQRFMREYRYTRRSVYEQVFLLDSLQKQKIFDFVEKNALPENKYYLYDFFFDNCATRIRDIFPETLGQSFIFGTEYAKNKNSFRDLIDLYLRNKPWAHFGINLALGAPTDRVATSQQYMFLPDYLKEACATAQIRGKYNKKNVIKKAHYLYKADNITARKSKIYDPVFVVWGLLVFFMVITIIGLINKRKYRIADFVFFFIIGLTGLVLILLWFFTDHKVVVKNWNLLWAFPTHLIAAFLLLKKNPPKWLNLYFILTSAVAIMLLIFWNIIPQRFDLRFIPLILIILIRSVNFVILKMVKH